jgi:prepilin peptidase CpaA
MDWRLAVLPEPLMSKAIEWTHQATILLVCIVLVVAAVSDIRRRRIPNWTILAIAILFGLWCWVEPTVSLASSLSAALIAFSISCALYYFGIVGAGDSKLITVTAMFAGLEHLLQFIFYMSLAGGLVVLCMLAVQPTKVLVILQTRGRGGMGISVPYGVAIAAAGVLLLLVPQPRLFI